MRANGFESNLSEEALAPVERWITDDELKDIYSSSYWNDIEDEKKKEWWIADGNYARCADYLRRSGLADGWVVAEKLVLEFFPDDVSAHVADLAAGIGWTSALLSKIRQVAKVHAVEISRHRLDLFPHAVDMFDGEAIKINRYLGSFYNLKLKDESMDLVLVSQGFHHANKPIKLMLEIDRVLRRGGGVILLGENNVGFVSQIRRMVSILLKDRRFSTNFYLNFPPDEVTGDHYYRLSDYYFLFQLLGYKATHRIVNKNSLLIMAVKN